MTCNQQAETGRGQRASLNRPAIGLDPIDRDADIETYGPGGDAHPAIRCTRACRRRRDRHSITYLETLRRLRLVERHIPVTESPTTSKRGRYRIAAPLFRFWFRFVYGNQDQLRLFDDDAYDELFAPALAEYVSPLFERLCQHALPDLIDRQFRAVGQWWFKDHELDVLGLSDEGLVAGECKFTAHPVSEGVLADLERTASEVQWTKEPADAETLYVLFSRSGYSTNLEHVAETRADVALFKPADLIAPERTP